MLFHWLLALRPKTLPASVAPILLGSALAASEGNFSGFIFWLAMICALSLQIAVNFANDLFDAASGVDTAERLGPVRVTQAGLIQPHQLKLGLAGILLLAVLSGLMLAAWVSWWLLPLGLASLLAALAYSGGPKPLASLGLGELLVLIFFGWVAVMGSYYLQSLSLNLEAFIYASLLGVWSASIMLVNNIRDRITDAKAAKRTLAVRLGDTHARRLYQGLLISGLSLHWLANPGLSQLSWLPLLLTSPLVLFLLWAIQRWQSRELNRLLALTALLVLIYALAQSWILAK
ncbi:1,4-dihydroxy-2-naphthoate prenyltransferase [Marinospirillum celere]|uniref:1,4-dihydroxy-2-naphthoate octaprenyltransferase n=1 Tax=Marinospirillum celere TaxID=1122252 RepID=A0A1I1EGA8_9GAMM|nr:1,4-dihydroxy-2-naphthoate polyprenyltransferase [Marinospirillum celere]SFB86057.1 1,4-dihydroxy-2-naphthoate prenyltransferase [Marinospirillum celere]